GAAIFFRCSVRCSRLTTLDGDPAADNTFPLTPATSRVRPTLPLRPFRIHDQVQVLLHVRRPEHRHLQMQPPQLGRPPGRQHPHPPPPPPRAPPPRTGAGPSLGPRGGPATPPSRAGRPASPPPAPPPSCTRSGPPRRRSSGSRRTLPRTTR